MLTNQKVRFACARSVATRRPAEDAARATESMAVLRRGAADKQVVRQTIAIERRGLCPGDAQWHGAGKCGWSKPGEQEHTPANELTRGRTHRPSECVAVWQRRGTTMPCGEHVTM